MDQKFGEPVTNCTWDGDIYPQGYSCCEGTTCMTCKDGKWEEQSGYEMPEKPKETGYPT